MSNETKSMIDTDGYMPDLEKLIDSLPRSQQAIIALRVISKFHDIPSQSPDMFKALADWIYEAK